MNKITHPTLSPYPTYNLSHDRTHTRDTPLGRSIHRKQYTHNTQTHFSTETGPERPRTMEDKGWGRRRKKKEERRRQRRKKKEEEEDKEERRKKTSELFNTRCMIWRSNSWSFRTLFFLPASRWVSTRVLGTFLFSLAVFARVVVLVRLGWKYTTTSVATPASYRTSYRITTLDNSLQ